MLERLQKIAEQYKLTIVFDKGNLMLLPQIDGDKGFNDSVTPLMVKDFKYTEDEFNQVLDTMQEGLEQGFDGLKEWSEKAKAAALESDKAAEAKKVQEKEAKDLEKKAKAYAEKEHYSEAIQFAEKSCKIKANPDLKKLIEEWRGKSQKGLF